MYGIKFSERVQHYQSISIFVQLVDVSMVVWKPKTDLQLGTLDPMEFHLAGLTRITRQGPRKTQFAFVSRGYSAAATSEREWDSITVVIEFEDEEAQENATAEILKIINSRDYKSPEVAGTGIDTDIGISRIKMSMVSSFIDATSPSIKSKRIEDDYDDSSMSSSYEGIPYSTQTALPLRTKMSVASSTIFLNAKSCPEIPKPKLPHPEKSPSVVGETPKFVSLPSKPATPVASTGPLKATNPLLSGFSRSNPPKKVESLLRPPHQSLVPVSVSRAPPRKAPVKSGFKSDDDEFWDVPSTKKTAAASLSIEDSPPSGQKKPVENRKGKTKSVKNEQASKRATTPKGAAASSNSRSSRTPKEQKKGAVAKVKVAASSAASSTPLLKSAEPAVPPAKQLKVPVASSSANTKSQATVISPHSLKRKYADLDNDGPQTRALPEPEPEPTPEPNSASVPNPASERSLRANQRAHRMERSEFVRRMKENGAKEKKRQKVQETSPLPPSTEKPLGKSKTRKSRAKRIVETEAEVEGGAADEDGPMESAEIENAAAADEGLPQAKEEPYHYGNIEMDDNSAESAVPLSPSPAPVETTKKTGSVKKVISKKGKSLASKAAPLKKISVVASEKRKSVVNIAQSERSIDAGGEGNGDNNLKPAKIKVPPHVTDLQPPRENVTENSSVGSGAAFSTPLKRSGDSSWPASLLGKRGSFAQNILGSLRGAKNSAPVSFASPLAAQIPPRAKVSKLPDSRVTKGKNVSALAGLAKNSAAASSASLSFRVPPGLKGVIPNERTLSFGTPLKVSRLFVANTPVQKARNSDADIIKTVTAAGAKAVAPPIKVAADVLPNNRTFGGGDHGNYSNNDESVNYSDASITLVNVASRDGFGAGAFTSQSPWDNEPSTYQDKKEKLLEKMEHQRNTFSELLGHLSRQIVQRMEYLEKRMVRDTEQFEDWFERAKVKLNSREASLAAEAERINVAAARTTQHSLASLKAWVAQHELETQSF